PTSYDQKVFRPVRRVDLPGHGHPVLAPPRQAVTQPWKEWILEIQVRGEEEVSEPPAFLLDDVNIHRFLPPNLQEQAVADVHTRAGEQPLLRAVRALTEEDRLGLEWARVEARVPEPPSRYRDHHHRHNGDAKPTAPSRPGR